MAAPPPYCSGLGERVSANQGGLWRRAAYCPLDTIYHAVVIGRVGSVRQCMHRSAVSEMCICVHAPSAPHIPHTQTLLRSSVSTSGRFQYCVYERAGGKRTKSSPLNSNVILGHACSLC